MASSQRQLQTTRRKHTNSKLGCSNCKKKKIRCDEHLPECKNCAKGKKNVCSYLSLSAKEINKIRLTHFLRSSQNKLLNSDYHLPSANKYSAGVYDELDFKHEMKNLPMQIPSFAYPPLQFRLVTNSDIENESRMDKDPGVASDQTSNMDPNSNPNSPVSMPNKGTALPGAYEQTQTFTKLKHKISIKPHIKIHEYQFMKVTNLDYLWPKIFLQDSKYKDLLNNHLVFMGRSIVLFEMKKSRPLNDPVIGSLTKQCFVNHAHCLTDLHLTLAEYYRKCAEDISPQNDEYINDAAPALFYANNFISYCVVLIDFSMENYSKISSTGLEVMKQFLVYNRGRPLKNLPKSIMSTLQYQMLSIKMPPYCPDFLQEVVNKMEELLPIITDLPSSNERYNLIKSQYLSLIKFVKSEFLPILETKAIGNKVISYPADVTYSLLKKWLAVYPSTSYVPISPSDCANDRLISDLTSTVFCYFYVIGGALRSILPHTIFLFGVSFTTLHMYPTKNFFQVSSALNSLSRNGENLQDLFQRHNYYALRVYSFLRHRTRTYISGVMWDPNYSEDRMSYRGFKNILEKPITSFAYTLVRPEHYVTSVDSGLEDHGGHKFERQDETMILKLYARNIEKLNFFDQTCILQFDYQSLALLRDYRPMPTSSVNQFPPLSIADLDYYIEDRRAIVKKLNHTV